MLSVNYKTTIRRQLEHITHITPGLTRVLIEMDMTKIKTKSNINGPNENFKN